jgi:hypothetical protein
MKKQVFIRISGGAPSFIAAMAAMREWLNQQGCEPSSFNCQKSGGTFAIQVGFAREQEAAAFERCFGRHGTQTPPTIFEELNDLPLNPHPGTMTQVRYWRLMAKEIRVKADELASTRQKPWPALVEIARTYEQMADNLERRLAKRQAHRAGDPRCGLARQQKQ